MNTFLPEHSGQDSSAAYDQGIYDWQPENVHLAASQAPYNGVSMRAGYPEHEFSMTPSPQFQYNPSLPQRASFGGLPQAGDVDYRGSSPHSAPPSGGNSPWNTGSIPTQEVMYNPDVDISKFNRGSRGSMNSLSLTSMRTSHPLANGHAYTSKMGMRPHAMSLSNMGPNDEQPWNLIPCAMPFAQDGVAGAGGIPGMAGASFFLRSPTPTKRQRTNQACEKCRERKAKCNGARPTCQRCAARGHICEYAKERRMRGPNKTGRRGSQADIEDPIDSPGRAAAALDPDMSETATHRDDSPASSRPGSRRSSSEAGQGESGSVSAAKSSSGSPEPLLRSGASAPIALPTLSNGNLSLMSYHPDSGAARQSADAQRMSSESALRYAQSMPQIGYRYGESHDGFAEPPTGAWNPPVDNQTVASLNVPEHHAREDVVSSEYTPTDMQTLHYSVSDVSSSSTPITPDRFEYVWPPADSSSPQQNVFAFGHSDKPQPMLPIPEFEGESNSLGELRVWTGSHSDKHPIMVPSGPENDQQNTLVPLKTIKLHSFLHKLTHRSRPRERKKASKDQENATHGQEQPSSPHQHQSPQPYSEPPKAQSPAHPTGNMSTLGVETPSMQRSRSPTPLNLKASRHQDLVHELIVQMRDEKNSEAHQIFRSYPGHAPKGMPQTVNPDEETVPGIQHPGSTGVIYCTDRAMANGFTYGDPTWANLGQGAPEVGDIPDAAPRPQTVTLPHDSLEYAPTTGVKELRKAVADLYNRTYRQGKKSQYTHENVCIVPGGRAGLSRVAAVVGDVYCGYQVPEYTTYSEVLSVFKRLVPIPTALTPESRYKIDINQAKKDISSQGLQVIVASNPRNPTGMVIQGEELKDLVRLCDNHCTVVLDEFYSWYIYPEDGELGKSISGAEYVEDVDDDAVVLIDGLTKNWRLPGWRVCWVVGPRNLISALSQSGSFLDGGANHPLQLAALPLLEPEHVEKEKLALQKHFRAKRDHVLKRLKRIGLEVTMPPEATFYIWLDLRALPAPLNDGLTFFEELLKEKTIVVPGIFFEINPAHRRDLFSSPCHHFVRISYGPPLEDLNKGLDAIERVFRKAKREGMSAIGADLIKSPVKDHFPGVH